MNNRSAFSELFTFFRFDFLFRLKTVEIYASQNKMDLQNRLANNIMLVWHFDKTEPN